MNIYIRPNNLENTNNLNNSNNLNNLENAGNFYKDTVNLYFEEKPSYDKINKCEIENISYIYSVTFYASFEKNIQREFSWHKFIKSVGILIDDNSVEKYDTLWIQSWYNMFKLRSPFVQNSKSFYLVLPFFFNKIPLPLFTMSKSRVFINIELSDFKNSNNNNYKVMTKKIKENVLKEIKAGDVIYQSGTMFLLEEISSDYIIISSEYHIPNKHDNFSSGPYHILTDGVNPEMVNSKEYNPISDSYLIVDIIVPKINLSVSNKIFFTLNIPKLVFSKKIYGHTEIEINTKNKVVLMLLWNLSVNKKVKGNLFNYAHIRSNARNITTSKLPAHYFSRMQHWSIINKEHISPNYEFNSYVYLFSFDPLSDDSPGYLKESKIILSVFTKEISGVDLNVYLYVKSMAVIKSDKFKIKF